MLVVYCERPELENDTASLIRYTWSSPSTGGISRDEAGGSRTESFY